jgi:hypothetical protein
LVFTPSMEARLIKSVTTLFVLPDYRWPRPRGHCYYTKHRIGGNYIHSCIPLFPYGTIHRSRRRNSSRRKNQLSWTVSSLYVYFILDHHQTRHSLTHSPTTFPIFLYTPIEQNVWQSQNLCTKILTKVRLSLYTKISILMRLVSQKMVSLKPRSVSCLKTSNFELFYIIVGQNRNQPRGYEDNGTLQLVVNFNIWGSNW